MSEAVLHQHSLRVPSARRLGSINFRAVRAAMVAACLEAMIEERRFMYTDMFIRK